MAANPDDGPALFAAKGVDVIDNPVAAFDVDAGVVTAGAVTAVLSHGDELFDVGLGDGSVLSVTDDHRFWDPSNTVWSPIGDHTVLDLSLIHISEPTRPY